MIKGVTMIKGEIMIILYIKVVAMIKGVLHDNSHVIMIIVPIMIILFIKGITMIIGIIMMGRMYSITNSSILMKFDDEYDGLVHGNMYQLPYVPKMGLAPISPLTGALP